MREVKHMCKYCEEQIKKDNFIPADEKKKIKRLIKENLNLLKRLAKQ